MVKKKNYEQIIRHLVSLISRITVITSEKSKTRINLSTFVKNRFLLQ